MKAERPSVCVCESVCLWLTNGDDNEEWDGVVRKAEWGRECKAELSFLASLVRVRGLQRGADGKNSPVA